MSESAVPQESGSKPVVNRPGIGIFSGRKGLKRREAFLAYLFLLPAMLIIGVFGLFPLVFSVYQSTRSGLNNVVGRPDGFGQYVRAIDNLAYVLSFWIAIFLIVMAVLAVREILEMARSKDDKPWFLTLPGLLNAVGFGQLAHFIFLYMPGLLEVGEKMRGFTAEERQELFPVFLREAWQVENVAFTFWSAIFALVLAFLLFQFVWPRISKNHLRDSFYYGKFHLCFFLHFIGWGCCFISPTAASTWRLPKR
jgi:ABC-type sugar transport system permease subunit